MNPCWGLDKGGEAQVYHKGRYSTFVEVQETNQLLEGLSSSMGFIQALSAHLHSYAWAYPNDLMPPSIQSAAAQTLYDVAAELQSPPPAGEAQADGALPAPFRCLLSMLASGNKWAVGMGQSWLLQLLLVHAEVVIAGEPLCRNLRLKLQRMSGPGSCSYCTCMLKCLCPINGGSHSQGVFSPGSSMLKWYGW